MEKNALNWSFPQLYMEYPHLHMELYGLYNMDYTQLTKDNQQLWLERHRPRLVKAFSFGAVGEGATATRFAKRSACAERLVICSSGMSQWNPETCKKKTWKIFAPILHLVKNVNHQICFMMFLYSTIFEMMIQTDYYSFPPKPFNTPQNHGLVRDSHIFGTMESGGVKKKRPMGFMMTSKTLIQ